MRVPLLVVPSLILLLSIQNILTEDPPAAVVEGEDLTPALSVGDTPALRTLEITAPRKPKGPTRAPGWWPGYCSDSNNKDQNDGVVSVKGETFEQCLEACKKQEGATGCEFYPPKKLCSTHTKDVARGSGKGDSLCFVLPKKVEFKEYPGMLKEVSIGPYGVWGVDKKDQIWKKSASSWKMVRGSLKSISVGKNSVWGTNMHDMIYKRVGKGNWKHIQGKLRMVSVSGASDSVVWGVSPIDEVFIWRGGNNWDRVTGTPEDHLKVVSAGEAGVWGLDKGGLVYYRTGTSGKDESGGTAWEKVDGQLSWISSGFAGQVWGGNTKGEIWEREGITKANPAGKAWKKVQGELAMVSVWETQAWGIKKEEAGNEGHGKIVYADLAGPACIEEKTDYWGNDLTKLEHIPSAYECACACKEYAGCSVFTWINSNKNCYLKTSDRGRKPHPNAQSGRVGCCEGCPGGYDSQEGDVPGWGQIQGKVITTMEGCSEACSKQEECCSYEYSYSSGLCNLNTDCQPSRKKFRDYHFCTRGFSSAKSSTRLNNADYFDAKWAIDGTTKYPSPPKYFFHSNGENYPWLELTLPEGRISGLEVVTRYDCCAARFKNIEVRAGMEAVPTGFHGRLTVNSKVAVYPGPAENGDTITIKFGRSVLAKYVTLQSIGQGVTLEVNEVKMLRSAEPKPKYGRKSKLRLRKANSCPGPDKSSLSPWLANALENFEKEIVVQFEKEKEKNSCKDKIFDKGDQEIKIEQSNLIDTLPYIGRQFSVSFELFVDKYSTAPYASILHLTVGRDITEQGDRIPGIWIKPDKKLLISSAISGNANSFKEHDGLNDNAWNKVEISQRLKDGKYMFEVFINGKEKQSDPNTTPNVYGNVKVFVGDPWNPPVDGKIRNLKIAYDEKEKATDGSVTVKERIIENENKEIRIEQTKKLDVMPFLEKEFSISFDLFIDKYPTAPYASILHLTVGRDITEQGDRIPGIWIKPDKKLVIASAISGNVNSFKDHDGLKDNAWNKVEISQKLKDGKYIFSVVINGESQRSDPNTAPARYNKVHVFAGDPWYPPADGAIKNLKIESDEENIIVSCPDGPGGDKQWDRLGQYVMMEDKDGEKKEINGRPVWKQKGGEQKLFYTGEEWFIGTDETKPIGGFKSELKDEESMASKWQYWTKEKGWQVDPKISISVGLLSFPSKLFIGSTGPAAGKQGNRMGLYVRDKKNWHGGLPVWVQKGGRAKLFYAGYWYLGDNEMADRGGIRSIDKGKESLPSKWQYWDGGWKEDDKITVSAKKVVYPPQLVIYSKGPAGKKHMGLMGIYVKMDDTWLNGRPVYEMKGDNQKLFFVGIIVVSDYYHVDNNKWYIGEDLPGETYDTATPVGAIRSAEPGEDILPKKWVFYADGKWQEDAELTISDAATPPPCAQGSVGDGFCCLPDSDLDGTPDINKSEDCSIHSKADNCPKKPNSGQEDADGDGVGDMCDDDADGDGVPNKEDNCPTIANPKQEDTDSDKVGDVCDNCPSEANPRPQNDSDSDGEGDVCDEDRDGDHVHNEEDNCPLINNPGQEDADEDYVGDVCDNCKDEENFEQTDVNNNMVGDACEGDKDDDKDGVPDNADNCPGVPNQCQTDIDNDGQGDACDDDDDNDGIPDAKDNCVVVCNKDQEDSDEDGVGDACEDDCDGDGISDKYDVCKDDPTKGKTDFSAMKTFNVGEGGTQPVWEFTDGGKQIKQLVNSIPTFALGVQKFDNIRFTGTLYVDTKRDNDMVGFLFNYQDYKNFYIVTASQEGSGQGNWALRRVNSKTGHPSKELKKALFGFGKSTGDTPVEGQTTVLYKHPTAGWKDHTAYSWLVEAKPDTAVKGAQNITLKISEGSKVIVDEVIVDKDGLAGGRLGVFCQSQEDVIWARMSTECV